MAESDSAVAGGAGTTAHNRSLSPQTAMYGDGYVPASPFHPTAPLRQLSPTGWAPTGERYSRTEENTSEHQSLMRISYADFCLQKNNTLHIRTRNPRHSDNDK